MESLADYRPSGYLREIDNPNGSARIMAGVPLAPNNLLSLQVQGFRNNGVTDVGVNNAAIDAQLGAFNARVGTDNAGNLHRGVGVNLPTKTNINIGDTTGRYYDGVNANVYQQLNNGGFGGYYSDEVANGHRNINHGFFADTMVAPNTAMSIAADSNGRGGYVPAALIKYSKEF